MKHAACCFMFLLINQSQWTTAVSPDNRIRYKHFVYLLFMKFNQLNTDMNHYVSLCPKCNGVTNKVTYFLNKLSKIVGFLSQRLCRQTVHKCDHAVWEVMLGKPTDNHSLLHVRPSCYVQYQITTLVPVPARKQRTNAQQIQLLTA